MTLEELKFQFFIDKQNNLVQIELLKINMAATYHAIAQKKAERQIKDRNKRIDNILNCDV